MADIQIFKYTGENHGANYEIKNAAFNIKTAKDYTQLTKALTINFFSSIDGFTSSLAENFKPFYRGYLQRALGEGLRDINDYGLMQVRRFDPAKPGDKLCLEVPNERNDREDIFGRITRLYCSAREPDILAAYDRFVDPDEMYEFQRRKVGKVVNSISCFVDIMFSYILAIDPWGDEFSDRINNYKIESILGAKWDDTPIGYFGEEKQGIGAILNSIKTDFADEIAKEKKIKNINIYTAADWYPYKHPKQENLRVVKKTAKAKKPTAELTSDKLSKIYFGNLETDPTGSIIAFCRCINYHADQMVNEYTGSNDSMFPGNMSKEERKKYGTEDPGANSTMLWPVKVPVENFYIVINDELYKEIKNAALVSRYTETGGYVEIVKQFLSRNIIPLSTMPYGACKMFNSNRYNLYDLYDLIEPDTLGQMMYSQFTAHRAMVFGIRKYAPIKYIRMTGLYINPAVEDLMKGVVDAVDLE